jgi:hypothetical protein
LRSRDLDSFIVENGDSIAPQARIVFGGFASATAATLRLPDGVVGAFMEFD